MSTLKSLRSSQKQEEGQNQEYITRLLLGMDSCRRNSQFVDTVLEFVNGKEIRAHSIVLNAGSPYFRNIFAKANRNPYDGKWRIKLPNNIKERIFLNILHFMYTGQIEIPFEEQEIKDLLVTSRSLELEEFSKQLAYSLIHYLSDANYLFVWDIADQYGLTDLSLQVIRFLNSHLERFLERPEISNFSLDRFLSLLKSPCFSLRFHNKLLSAIIRWYKHDYRNRMESVQELLRYVKFSTLSKPFLQSLLSQEPMIQRSECLKNYITAALYQRGVNKSKKESGAKGSSSNTSISSSSPSPRMRSGYESMLNPRSPHRPSSSRSPTIKVKMATKNVGFYTKK